MCTNLPYFIYFISAKLSDRCFNTLFSMSKIILCRFRNATSTDTSERFVCTHKIYNMTWLEFIKY